MKLDCSPWMPLTGLHAIATAFIYAWTWLSITVLHLSIILLHYMNGKQNIRSTALAISSCYICFQRSLIRVVHILQKEDTKSKRVSMMDHTQQNCIWKLSCVWTVVFSYNNLTGAPKRWNLTLLHETIYMTNPCSLERRADRSLCSSRKQVNLLTY